jgi:trehalose/maltose transport system substrate-binding protein
MAGRIQKGERAKGRKDFWGYVWQGNAAESLTCNALEWQVSAGGGRIIEQDRTVSVNNPAAIGAWQRAKHWIGWISPPGVVAYRETDSMLVFDSGRAAFSRIWILTPMSKKGQARHIGWRSLPPVMQTGLAQMPGGSDISAGTLGGTGTAVSSHSTHRQEAIALLRYQLRSLIDEGEKGGGSGEANLVELANLPSISDALAQQSPTQRVNVIVDRPSTETGSAYKAVSQAYSDAVHSVLTGEKSAPEAAAELEKQLIEITGFRPGPPRTTNDKIE